MSARLPRVAQLEVETPQGHAGRLGNERGSYLFVYDNGADPSTAVSLLMPVRLTPYQSGALLRAKDFVRNLSYGEQKLLTVARVLATGAELLLLDEPASGLSAGALDAVMALLRRLQADGKTLLVVEHNTRVVQQIADDVLFLHQGHLMAQGAPAEIISDPALAEIYFGGAI